MAIREQIYGDSIEQAIAAGIEVDTLIAVGGEAAISIKYVGAVLDKREENGYDDSDFYAVVWDEAEGRLKKEFYATTRAWTYNNSASVDATPEVIEKAAAWLGQWGIDQWTLANERQAKEVKKDRHVKVVGGSKVTHGTEGIVFWIGKDQFKKYGMRAGVKLDSGEKVFLDTDYLEIANPTEYLQPVSEAERYGAALAASRRWYTPFTHMGTVM